MRATHRSRGNLADPKWARLASLDFVISVHSLVLRRIARCQRPLYISPTAIADLCKMGGSLCVRQMDATRSLSAPACCMGTKDSPDRLRHEFAEVD